MELKRTKLAVACERAILVGASQGDPVFIRESLEELRRLADTAGARVVGECVQHRPSPDPATFLGAGKVLELTELCRSLDADVILLDVDLTTAQLRNLERATDCKVVDRTELILDIFARGARTAAACDQVELAQLEYLLPRLRRMWTHLERVEGGIGMRGPGERQIETDRRLVRKRVQALKRRIEQTEKRREQEVLSRADEITVCLVGYTNAGKSTLMNALTHASVLADDKLFSTLDTRTRLCEIAEGRRILLSDTVGFIRKLPHDLVASFHATLEEARQADLLLHVVDAASPNVEQQMEAVMEVLRELGCAEHPILCVYNKADLVQDQTFLPPLKHRFGDGVTVSAKTGEGLDPLRARVRDFLNLRSLTVEVEMPPGAGKLQAFLAENSEVISSNYQEDFVRMTVRVSPRRLGAIRRLGGTVNHLQAESAPAGTR